MPVRGRNAGNRGQGSKWCSKAKRGAIYARDGGCCVWCGSALELTIDHLIPRSKGGSNDPSNLVTTCMGCNRKRGNRPLREWVCSAECGFPEQVALRLARALDGAPSIPGFGRCAPKARAA